MRTVLSILAAGACVVLVPAARAEVRIQGSAPLTRVAVHQTSAGPWSPLGLPDSRSLNPDGDLNGDGTPTIVPGVSGTAVAWRAAHGSALRLAIADEQWHDAEWTQDNETVDFPRLVRLADSWCVAWTTPDGETGVALVRPDGDPAGQPFFLEGVLIGMTADLVSVHVLTLSVRGELLLSTVIGYIPSPVPTPFPEMRTIALATSFSESGARPSGGLTPQFVVEPPRFYSLSKRDGEGGLAVTWWPHAQELRVVEVNTLGAVLPVVIVGVERAPQAALKQALRDIARR